MKCSGKTLKVTFAMKAVIVVFAFGYIIEPRVITRGNLCHVDSKMLEFLSQMR